MTSSVAQAHRWNAEECGVAASDAGVAAIMRDQGKTEMQVKELMLYVLHRPDPKTVYQDAEDLYIMLSMVDYVFVHHSDSANELEPRIYAACKAGLNKV